MTSDMTISVALIFSIIAAVGTITSVISNVNKQREVEEQRRLDIEKNFVKINLKLDDFCDTTKTLMRNSERGNETMQELAKQMISHSERIETLFKCTKDHEERIKKLETGEEHD